MMTGPWEETNVQSGSWMEPDSDIQAIVSGWPTHFNAVRGTSLGFPIDSGIVEIIESFIEDELDGTFVS